MQTNPIKSILLLLFFLLMLLFSGHTKGHTVDYPLPPGPINLSEIIHQLECPAQGREQAIGGQVVVKSKVEKLCFEPTKDKAGNNTSNWMQFPVAFEIE